ncbi:L,D-transpeptidase [Rhodoblastus sp.]|uniref:L,D-transpeptidase n=1 Tax=Rhodoblastus sp. TaxID=1962975 RepID=UPI0026115CED|nr:L,D-transpeptidase [Rhodoblastus sp.]
MRNLARLFLIFAVFLVAPAAMARVQISIDLSAQRMEVQASDGESYSWPISSARAGYVTPRGVFAPTSMQLMHYSKKYHHSPMPHSIFFHGGYAIHGTYATRWLGRPVSHGCVRISPANAATLYSLVRAEGATIRITGSPPRNRAFAHQWRRHAHGSHYASAGHRRHYAGSWRTHGAHRGYASAGGGRHPHVLSYAPAPQGSTATGIFGLILNR